MKFSDSSFGFSCAIFSFMFWGLCPIFFKLYGGEVSSVEILIHRIIWSFFALGFVVVFMKKFGEVVKIFTNAKLLKILIIASLLNATNWWVYVYAVSSEQILAVGFGQFLNPLFNVILGAIVLKESLSAAGKFAVFVIVLAIGVQIYAMGEFPLLSLVLPLSFVIYGLVKKRIKVPSLPSMFVEISVLMPLAIGYFAYLCMNDQSHFGLNLNGSLMMLSGLVTVVPLLAFNLSITRVNLTTIGFIQYAIPILSVILAVFYGEKLDMWRVVSFALIWIAIIVVSMDGILAKRRANGAK